MKSLVIKIFSNMVIQETEGIKVGVETQYLAEYSNPQAMHFVFTYKITIQNESTYTYQLLRRHWEIHDASAPIKMIDGDGVVGQQPTLEPGQSHQYVSGCNLQSGIGKMLGYYEMERIVDGKIIQVQIPEFQLMAHYLQN